MTENAAFLFYSHDFLDGTLALAMEDRGKYITLLCYMHAHGWLEEETVMQLAGNMSKALRAKFSIDENGLWYNKRLEKEIKNRGKFIQSRRTNGKRGGRPYKVESVDANQPLLFDDLAKAVFEARPADVNGIPPTPKEVKRCFITHGLCLTDAEYETLKFMAHYTGTGWKTNSGSTIKDWKAAVRNWLIHRNQFLLNNKQPKTLTEQWLA
jgi:hypothetical protein